MLSKTTEKLIKELNKANLHTEDRIALTTALLDKLVALPIKDTFSVSNDGITIKGRELEPEDMISFRESCVALKDNFARKILREQIKYLAIQYGVHNGLNTDTIMFSKAILWSMQEEDKLLDTIL